MNRRDLIKKAGTLALLPCLALTGLVKGGEKNSCTVQPNKKELEVHFVIFQNTCWYEIWPKDGKSWIERYKNGEQPEQVIRLCEATLENIKFFRELNPITSTKDVRSFYETIR